jgi:Bax protein
MKIEKREWQLIILTVILLGSIFVISSWSLRHVLFPEPPIPDFAQFKDVKEKKQAFFNYLAPMVKKANEQVLSERNRILSLQGQTRLTRSERDELQVIALRYRLKDFRPDTGGFRELLHRVDALPASLVLAQGATESSWGSSRFARDGKNFFGLWCYTEDCGLVPEQRDSNRHHKVAEFGSVQDGVDYYFYTLNSHPAYNELRGIRADFSGSHRPVTGPVLAAGLILYSERREAYVDEIQAMIRINGLTDYDPLIERPGNIE